MNVRVLVGGLVQGVNFRWRCAERARTRGVGGWVRNLPDGRVEAVFEGPSEDVEAMVAWCHGGPRSARVTSVDATQQELQGLDRFDVRY